MPRTLLSMQITEPSRFSASASSAAFIVPASMARLGRAICPAIFSCISIKTKTSFAASRTAVLAAACAGKSR